MNVFTTLLGAPASRSVDQLARGGGLARMRWFGSVRTSFVHPRRGASKILVLPRSATLQDRVNLDQFASDSWACVLLP